MPITNYGKLLAEIDYFISIGNDDQAERLSKILDKAREQDHKNLTKALDQAKLENEGCLTDEVKQ